MLNAALATYALPRFAAALRLANVANDTWRKAEQFAASQRTAILAPGRGWDPVANWLRRAWLGKTKGWVGGPGDGPNDGVYSPQHGFAFLGGAFDADADRRAAAVDALESHCRPGWPYGYAYHCDADKDAPIDSGEGPGMWPALDYPTAMGLGRIGQTEEAWREFQRNSLSWQATVTPRVWAGIWSSADEISADGTTGPVGRNYPALCMHRHAWPIVAAAALAGLHFDERGLVLRPMLPLRLGATNYTATTAALRWDPGSRTYSGYYEPAARARAKFGIATELGRRHPGDTVVTLTARVRAVQRHRGHGPGTGAVVEQTATGRSSEVSLTMVTMQEASRVEFEVVLH